METTGKVWRRSCRLVESDGIPIDPVQKYNDPPVGRTDAADFSAVAKSGVQSHAVVSDGDATEEKTPYCKTPRQQNGEPSIATESEKRVL